ncbi:hypothetical protein L3X38_008688 [Prunus dulcis]|uniref:Uncharacterized protein n=1 Tax=Prunus dulcis TaxID=3755 RepID=A0AAD4ZWW4_PRUDU|nr:hypothetical protein L3X38_008688 [Prunus dulcis]
MHLPTLPVVPDNLGWGLKHLYICVVETKYDVLCDTIHAIQLKDLLNSSSSSESSTTASQLSKVACSYNDEDGVPLPRLMGCGVFGSQILFACGFVSPSECRSGTELCGFEMPSTLTSTVESSSSQLNNIIIKPKRFISNCLGGKPHPLLVELRGRLYALAGNPTACRSDVCFEAGNLLRRSAVSRVALLARARREEALQGVARRSEAERGGARSGQF